MNAVQSHAVTGELRWNIKQSFRDYVGELPDGAEVLLGEAGGDDRGDLVFPATEVVTLSEKGDLVLKFAGGVHYEGYRGMLRVDLRDPWIEVAPEGGASITANIAPESSEPHRVALAVASRQPSPVDRGWEWHVAATSLTAAGAALLGSVYQPGAEADGFTVLVSAV